MSFRTETFCKILSKSANSSSISNNSQQKPVISVHQNKLVALSPGNSQQQTDERREWQFTRVFSPDQKNTNDLYSTVCGKLTQHFLNGFNCSLILLGSSECLLHLLNDNKGPLIYLTEQLSNFATKQFKNLKQPSQISVKSMSSLAGSLPYLKIKNDVEMTIYQLDANGVLDLSNRKISVLGEFEFF